jgi:hypothetical protein
VIRTRTAGTTSCDSGSGDRVIATVTGLVGADLERTGLYYGWNDPSGGTNPGCVTFVPTAAFPT